jgi:hypothetical protein
MNGEKTTNADAVLAQPFAVLVTVTTYVPLMLTVGFAVTPPLTIPGPLQLKLEPVVVPAERTTKVIVPVNVPPVALAPGAVAFVATKAVAVLVQPVVELVTVTMYVPELETVGLAVGPPETMPGPVQLNPVPEVVAADNLTEVVAQVSVPPVAVAPGGPTFDVTDAVAVLVQPFKELVTVTV